MRHKPWRWWWRWGEMYKVDKGESLRWWLRDARGGKGDRGLGDDAHVCGMSNLGVYHRPLRVAAQVGTGHG